MRPKLTFLKDELVENIISEAMLLLKNLGVEINNKSVLSMLSDNGAEVELAKSRVYFSIGMVEEAISTAVPSFQLYDVLGNQTHDFAGDIIHFTPGSSALKILDLSSNEMRKPNTQDYINYAKVVSQLDYIASQSTALIPADVHENISDSYRLFLSLMYCEKPVVTGTFSAEAFIVMKELQLAIRGFDLALKEKPLTIFTCCPTSPLKWGEAASQNVVDCARYSIPVEFVPMPLSGFIAPVTLVGTLIQQTAENLSGIVIHQLVNPGAPCLFGGSPAIFDVRYETTPMGAIETMMIDCAANEIGKHLGLPTQAYISLSDAKFLDSQAGLETGIGATLGALSGINNMSGPGMLDFESCHSIEKLVVDNEICGMVLRLIQGIKPRDDFPAEPIFAELLREQHLLISDHTMRNLYKEHTFPGPVINRANNSRWQEDGGTTLLERAHSEVEKLLQNYHPSGLSEETKKDLIKIMEKEARRWGQDKLPERSL